MSGEDGTPEVAVVVATHQRPAGLRRLMRSLAAQRLAADRFEVVVVDDGSPTPVGEQLERLEARPRRLRVIRRERSEGPATARNAGWRASAAPLVAFTDDDCVAAPGWLQALLAAAGSDRICQGRTEPDLGPGESLGPFDRSQRISGPTGLYETCNVAYPRELVERVGGFDESFANACGEDVDLGRRAAAAGGELTFVREAVVRHAVEHPTIAETVRWTLKWHDAVRVVARYPELRSLLVGGVFWKPSHPPLIAALALSALALVSRRPAPLIAAPWPYLAHYALRYRDASLRSLLGLVARRLPIDLAELGTMIRGSIRHRTLML